MGTDSAYDRSKSGNGNKIIALGVGVTTPSPLLDDSSLPRAQLHLAEQSPTFLTLQEESSQGHAVVLEAGLDQAIVRDHFRQLWLRLLVA